MTFRVSISGVDGETELYIQTKDAQAAYDFLLRHDHEGSSIGLSVQDGNPDEVYGMLTALKALGASSDVVLQK